MHFLQVSIIYLLLCKTEHLYFDFRPNAKPETLGTIMESGKIMHQRIMKFSLFILILINTSCFAQDSIPFSSHYVVDNEIKCCFRAKNQLHCLDSLIQLNLKTPEYSGKENRRKVYLDRYRKLFIYHLNAGYVSGFRENLVQSFSYFDLSEHYLDTLKQNGKDDEFKDFKEIIRYQKTEFCSKTYFKDTALFNQCNCAQFFPEIKDEFVIADTATSPNEKQILPIKYPNWGEFYINDTLRINKQFVSDSAGIVYFKKVMQPLLLTKLQQNPVYMLGDPAMNLKRDTIIYKLSSKYVKGSYERKCELVFASSQNPEKYDHLMILLSNMEFPGFINNLALFIPIVVTTENSIDTNKATIYDDHFLIEVIKLKRIDPK